MKALRNAFFAFLLISIPFAQRIDPVDLTRLPEISKNTADLPDGCKALSGGTIADGQLLPKDHSPERIVVEIVSVKDRKLTLGSEATAEVRFRNADTSTITIPWSTEFSAIHNGQSPNALRFEEGTFEFRLTNQKSQEVLLKSLTASLYGSDASPGSQLAVAPGESVTALVKFKLEEEFQIPPLRLKEGEWQLTAKWILTGRHWAINENCSLSNAYFHGDGFYQQRNPALTIQVASGAANPGQKPPD